MNIVTVRKEENNGWRLNDRNTRRKKPIIYATKVEAVKNAKQIARDKQGVFAIIDNRNEPIEVMSYSRNNHFVKDKTRRNKILRSVVKTALNNAAS